MFKDMLKKIFGESKSGLIPRGGIGENIPLKEVNINIGKPGQIIIIGRG